MSSLSHFGHHSEAIMAQASGTGVSCSLLMGRHVLSHVTRLLRNMYTGQQVRILWNGVS
jgi:hypothetical protein